MHRIADLSAFARAASAGDEEAFRVLYQQVQPGLLRYLAGLVGDDADDVAAEAWLQIARDIRTYRDEGVGFRAWAATIARHRAFDHLRQQRRRPRVVAPTEWLAERPGGHDTEERALEALAMRAAIAWIATLPRDQAEAILLRVVVGLDAEGAARVLGKRPGAVRTAAHRGLRRLAERLDQAGAERLDRHTTAELPPPEPRGRLRRSAGVTVPRPATPRDSR